MKFLYFEDNVGIRYDKAVVSIDQFDESFCDPYVIISIVDGKIELEAKGNIFLDGENWDEKINKDLKELKIDWEFGYDYINFSAIGDDSKPLSLLADEQSGQTKEVKKLNRESRRLNK